MAYQSIEELQRDVLEIQKQLRHNNADVQHILHQLELLRQVNDTLIRMLDRMLSDEQRIHNLFH